MSGEQVAAAFRGEQQGEFISFASVELLWKVLTVKRWEILKAMTGQGEMAMREIAGRVGGIRECGVSGVDMRELADLSTESMAARAERPRTRQGSAPQARTKARAKMLRESSPEALRSHVAVVLGRDDSSRNFRKSSIHSREFKKFQVLVWRAD